MPYILGIPALIDLGATTRPVPTKTLSPINGMNQRVETSLLRHHAYEESCACETQFSLRFGDHNTPSMA